MYDFEALDASWGFDHRQEKLQRARALGFEHITEMFYELYSELCSSRYVGEVVGVSSSNVQRVLRHIGVTLLPQGGKHRAILSPATVTELREGWVRDGHRYLVKNQYVREFRRSRDLPVSDRCLENALAGYTWRALEEKP